MGSKMITSHSDTINFSSPEGEGFPPSPIGTLKSRATGIARWISWAGNKTIGRDNITTAFDDRVMKVSPCAGKPAEILMPVKVPRLVTAYYMERPGTSVPEQRAAFGTSGHRGSAFKKSVNEWHVPVISQAICL
jgi:hypothetical protein